MSVDDPILRKITDHAREAYPKECCGFLIEVAGDLTVSRQENVAADPYSAFSIKPEAYLSVHDRIVAIYHSHPDNPCTLSTADKKSADRLDVPIMALSYPGGEVTCYKPEPPTTVVGVPFVYGLFDCYSMVKDYYEMFLCQALPEIVRPPFGWWTDPDSNHLDLLRQHIDLEYVDLNDIQRGDVLAMQFGDAATAGHLSVYVGNSTVLHHSLSGLSHYAVYGRTYRNNTRAAGRLHAD